MKEKSGGFEGNSRVLQHRADVITSPKPVLKALNQKKDLILLQVTWKGNNSKLAIKCIPTSTRVLQSESGEWKSCFRAKIKKRSSARIAKLCEARGQQGTIVSF